MHIISQQLKRNHLQTTYKPIRMVDNMVEATRTLPLGQVLVTRGVDAQMKDSLGFMTHVMTCLDRHMVCDWGDLCEEDRQMNEEALDPECPERIMSVWNHQTWPTVWIITEWDRQHTTVLLPEEY